MTSHQVGTRAQWAAAYAELRAEEKELTRRTAALAGKRQALPWVPVEKQYRFETNDGTTTLAELLTRPAWAGRSSGCPPRDRTRWTCSPTNPVPPSRHPIPTGQRQSDRICRQWIRPFDSGSGEEAGWELTGQRTSI